MKQKIYNVLPLFFKNILVTIYNLRFFKIYGAEYKDKLNEASDFYHNKSREELLEIQRERLIEFWYNARNNNKFYAGSEYDFEVNSVEDLKKLPILTKEHLRREDIKSGYYEQNLIKGNTGGSTGKSLEFYMTQCDFIQRQATLNFFRGIYGYKIGSKIGWFSGKEIITDKEVLRNKFWVKDYLHNITYFSTFHLSEKSLDSMIYEINKSGIEYLSGFPSAIYDLAKQWDKSKKPVNTKIKAIFPTAEPLHEYQKQFLEDFFNCHVPDQYASSEGTHFIYECPEGKLHYDLTTGVFETLSDDSNEVLVTSFTTNEMPLIRYRIGDGITFSDSSSQCECGTYMPIVKSIIGRSVAYVYSKERGRITVSNISNVVKYLKVIDNIQLVQINEDLIKVKVALDLSIDREDIINKLEYELRYRLGDEIELEYEFMERIPTEPNGKYLMIKNMLV
ncbi:hypothetical protein L3V31_09925 [Vibrio sp. J1-1]|uniref:hypothetical protein n=1 Tax=Vibrio sp. J1-1 TaxID=2912251 RepID=UPI001F1D9959|nr:hypothetical protein [Vibrio sp. J1-1]MCF7482050.1 hypothetical protein [Vibrio sp. J1-1]